MGLVKSSEKPAQRTNTPAKTAASAPPAGGKAKRGLFGGGFGGATRRGSNGAFLAPKRQAVIENKEVTDAGEAGVYLLKINRVTLKDKESAFKGNESFIVEGEVLESNVPACPAGYQFSWVTIDAWEGYLNDVKGFICDALGGADPEQVDEDDLSAVIGEDQALANKQIRCVVKDKMTKKGGRFTQHLWAPADNDTAATDEDAA
jgi:hypothetical protein